MFKFWDDKCTGANGEEGREENVDISRAGMSSKNFLKVHHNFENIPVWNTWLKQQNTINRNHTLLDVGMWLDKGLENLELCNLKKTLHWLRRGIKKI